MTGDHAIGIVGAGLIVENAHLPAYRGAGLDIRGIYDTNQARASALAAKFAIQHFETLDELLAESDIDVVDIAITPYAQLEIARLALDMGKHLLCQKPLGPTVSEAATLVRYAEAKNRKLAVNQQMRWTPTVSAMREALADGTVGHPLVLSYRLNMLGEYPADHWISSEKRYMALYGTVHYIDSARHLFGEPDRATARLLTDPRQNAVGETWINAWIEWEDGPFFSIFERYTSRLGNNDVVFTLEGTNGAVRGLLGIYQDYPNPHPDRVEVFTHEDRDWRARSDEGTWLPGAFAGPMRALMSAIDNDSTPPTSGADNLLTLRVVEALYRSNEIRESVAIDDIDISPAQDAR